MDSTLKNIYLHLNKSAATLAQSALQQIIIKLIYSHSNRVSANDLFKEYKSVIKRNDASKEEFDELLNSLLNNQQIRKNKNLYYISSSQRQKIDNECNESRNRKERILEKYFSELYTSSSVLRIWLEDVSIHFFKEFSSDWISDLIDKTTAVVLNKQSINNIVTNRTLHIKEVDKRDYENLVTKFFSFVTSNLDSDVLAYLWEYGTSAFSARLISNQKGVDSLTLDTFRNSKCLLDTNILLFIALESNKYHKSLASIESAFESLNIEANYLYITREEYQAKIECQRKNTLYNLEKYGCDTVLLPKDDFTSTAKLRRCSNESDFTRFFDQIAQIPQYINERVKISLIDDKDLINVIESAQNNDEKKKNLNKLYIDATGNEKRSNPLVHDVGLIAGAEYLRQDEKIFIMSEEIGINSYSKIQPTSNNLPLSIRVMTFINILAIDNGGAAFNADDYMPLFASIIKNGVQPNKDVFDQIDLYKLYQLDAGIAKLPSCEVRKIAIEMHNKMLKGFSTDDLRVDLDRKITKGELTVREQLAEKDGELVLSNKQISRLSKLNDQKDDVIRNLYYEQESKKYDLETKEMTRNLFVKRIVFYLLFLSIVLSIEYFIGNNVGGVDSFIISLLVSVLFDKYSFLEKQKKELTNRKKNRESNINDLVNSHMKNSLSS